MVKAARSGVFIFPSDACYSAHNYGPPIVLPGFCVDPENYKANIERLSKMKSQFTDAHIVFGHDVADFKQWKVAPDFYE